MSFTQTVKKAAQAVTGQRTMHLQFRTTFCRPAMRRDRETGLESECSRTIRAGEIVEVPSDDPEMLALVERRYAFIVEKTRDERGREAFVGVEPAEPPQMDPPVSAKLDPTAVENQQLGLLRRLVDALERNGVGAVAKGSA